MREIQPHSICRDLAAGQRCITVVPQGTAFGIMREIDVASSFQSAFRKAMDLARWGGPVCLTPVEEPS